MCHFSLMFSPPATACHGDSGGAAVVFDSETNVPTIVGIVSWGKGCALRKFPGVYSRVIAARKWIEDLTEIS